jgi:hypothetical protein
MAAKGHAAQVGVKDRYVAPSIEVLGSLSELTLREKEFGVPNDGDFMYGKSLTTVS